MTAALCAAWLAAAPAVPPSEPPRSPRAEVVKLTDGTRTDLTLDGPILGWSVIRKGERRLVVALVGPPEAKRGPSVCGVEEAAATKPRHEARLFIWDPAPAGKLSQIGASLPEGAFRAADLDGDGSDELVVYAESGIEELVVDVEAGTTAVRRLVDGRLAPVLDDTGEDRDLRAISLGALTTYRRGEGSSLRPTGEVELPILAYRRSEGIHVSTSSLRPLGRLADGRLRLAGGLERIPDLRRVRTLLLDPEGPPESRVIEAWGRFPARERALEHDVALLDGNPVLVVLTMEGDKLSLFGEKLLRVFPLHGDRTRSGVPPTLATETGINIWQATSPEILDLDGDGRDDLVLAYWKGLKDTIAALEVRRRADDGSFEKARTFDFDVPEGDRGSQFYGEDLDGDGRPDLALRADGALAVYPGSPKERAIERPVGKVPSRRIPLPEDVSQVASQSMSFGPEGISVDRVVTDFRIPRFVDLDGDGRVEAIFAGGSGQEGRLAVVHFR